jgi:hypothetical protein
MSRKTIAGGLAATIAALAIAAPAHAQEITPPAQPSTPSGQPATPVVPPAQPSAPSTTIGFGAKSTVARSRHGYTYAVVTVRADNVPSGQAASISYRSNLHAFKPRTRVVWSGTTGTITLSNDSVSGETSNVVTRFKLAFKGKSVARVRRDLVVTATGSNGAVLTQPTAVG